MVRAPGGARVCRCGALRRSLSFGTRCRNGRWKAVVCRRPCRRTYPGSLTLLLPLGRCASNSNTRSIPRHFRVRERPAQTSKVGSCLPPATSSRWWPRGRRGGRRLGSGAWCAPRADPSTPSRAYARVRARPGRGICLRCATAGFGTDGNGRSGVELASQTPRTDRFGVVHPPGPAWSTWRIFADQE